MCFPVFLRLCHDQHFFSLSPRALRVLTLGTVTRAGHQLHFFPRLEPVTFFPRLAPVTCFPALPSVTCFAALGTGYMFSRFCHRLHVLPPRSLVARIIVALIGLFIPTKKGLSFVNWKNCAIVERHQGQ